MYSILIVDDEKIIREGISKMMPWKELNISKVMQAENGRQALLLARDQQPDIILTDICMPDMDGLQFINELVNCSNNSETGLYDPKILVLTGHDRFEYAQQSCKLGVKDLLLKPVDEKLLIQVLAKQIEVVAEQQAELQRQRLMELQLYRQAAQARHLRLEQILLGIIDNKEPAADDLKWLKQHEPRLLSSYRLASLRVQSLSGMNDDDLELTRYGINQLCRQMIETSNLGLSFHISGSNLFLCWFFIQEDNRLLETLDQLCNLIKREFGISAKAGISQTGESLVQTASCWLEAREAIGSGQAVGANVYLADDSARAALVLKSVYDQKRSRLKEKDDESQLQMEINELTELLPKLTENSGWVKKECGELAFFFHWQRLTSRNIEIDSNERDSLDRFLQDLTRLDANSACQRLNSFIQESILQDESRTIVNPLIQKAVQHIKAHLSEELSVAGLADLLHVSPNYLSRIFRQSVNEGCNEFIVRKRMELAQTLLATTALKTYEIAEQVGYQDKNYFSLAFRKHTGQSPTDFRKALQNQ